VSPLLFTTGFFCHQSDLSFEFGLFDAGVALGEGGGGGEGSKSFEEGYRRGRILERNCDKSQSQDFSSLLFTVNSINRLTSKSGLLRKHCIRRPQV
jgi:hypothetical protein